MSKVIILRGLQGAGKSTFVKDMCDAFTVQNTTFAVFSADHYWIDPITKEYKFVLEDLGKAHATCFRDFIEAAQRNSHIKDYDYFFIDNTNIRPPDIAPYIAVANAYGLDHEIITIMCDPEVGIKRNIHGVAAKTIKDNHKALLKIQLPPRWNHTIIDPHNLMGKITVNPLEELKSYAERFNVVDIANRVLDNPKFPEWSGSSRKEQHHYGRGGLIEHTLEVVELCLQTSKYFQNKSKSVEDRQLFLAALFHDCGKMWDYEPLDENYTEWQGNLHKKKIHHISRSVLEWNVACFDFTNYSHVKDTSWLTQEVQDEITHAILSHHGLKEWGSPVMPSTRLAYFLHLCDGISARTDDVYRNVKH